MIRADRFRKLYLRRRSFFIAVGLLVTGYAWIIQNRWFIVLYLLVMGLDIFMFNWNHRLSCKTDADEMSQAYVFIDALLVLNIVAGVHYSIVWLASAFVLWWAYKEDKDHEVTPAE